MSAPGRSAWFSFALGAFTATTIGIGLLVRFRPEPSGLRPWITPLCVLTAMGALAAACYLTPRSSGK